MNIEEDKNYVTSYAFGVSPELIGKALASSSRRFWSIFIDAIIVSSLTLMSTTIMAICVFVVSLVGFRKARKEEIGAPSPTMLPNIFIAMAVVSALVIITSVSVNTVADEVESWSWSLSSDEEGVPETDALQSDSAEKDESEPDAEDKQEAVDEGLSFITLAKAALDDLGLGFGWAALYFSVFTAWFRGQTIGKMLLGLRVMKIDGKPISLWESFGRYGGYSAGIATGLLGFLQILWDPNRQAIHDKISETVVLNLRKPDQAKSTI